MLFAMSSTAQPLITIDLEEQTNASTSEFTEVDVDISGFVNMLSAQFAVKWDPEVLEVQSVSNLSSDLPDFSTGSISLPEQTNEPGVIRLSWLSAAVEEVTLPDEHRLFTIKLKYVGEACDETLVEVGEASPTIVEFIDENFDNVPLQANNITVQVPGQNCGGSGGSIICRPEITVDVKPWVCEGEVRVESIIGNVAYDHATVNPDVLTEDHLNIPIDVTATITRNGVTTTCVTSATLVDNFAPIVVVDSDITIELSATGNEPPTAILLAEDVDEGSYDQCSNLVSFSPEFWEFDCSDIGKQVIVLEVEDANGNSNSAWTEVTVKYDVTGSPVLSCPGDVMVDCSLDVNDQENIDQILGGATVDFGCLPEFETVYDYDANGDGDLNDTFEFNGITVNEKYVRACNYGPLVRIWTVPGINQKCQQIIIVEEGPAFDGTTMIDWPYSLNAFVEVGDNDGGEACSNTAAFPGNIIDPANITLFPDASAPESAEVVLNCEEDLCSVPMWDESTCSLLGFSVETERFENTADACVKIVKTYTVVDWCNYDPAISPTAGIWEWTVVGIINDNNPPQLVTPDLNDIACSNVIEASAVASEFSTQPDGSIAEFSCVTGNIQWVVLLDINNDGTYDREWNSNVAEDKNTANDPLWSDDNEQENIAEFGYGIPDVRVGNKGDVDNAFGPKTRSGQTYTIKIRDYLASLGGVSHRILWQAQDNCGNISSSESFITIDGSQDDVKPTPYCLNLVTATLQPTTGSNASSFELFAKDIDAGSFDNCTAEEDLRFTFSNVPPSSDPDFNLALNSSSRIFTEADLNGAASLDVPLTMYVWDESGNFDFCSVVLRLKSPDDPCLVSNVSCARLQVSLDLNGEARLWVQDLNVQYSNPCNVNNIDLSFNANHSDIDFLDLDCSHLGSLDYKVYIFQNNQRVSSCQNKIEIRDLNGACNNTGEPVELHFADYYALPADNICVPMTVKNFKEVNGFQGSVSWDTDILLYTNTSGYNLPGMSEASFGETNVDAGQLAFLWFDLSGVTPISFPDGEAVFEVCFEVVGELGDVSPIGISDDPTTIQVSTDNGVLDYMINNGQIIVGEDPCLSNADTIKPIPVCLQSLTATLVANNPAGTDAEIEVWAIDYDAGSYDNCTSDDNLRFTFSDTNPDDDPEYVGSAKSSSRIFTQADLTNSSAEISLDVYVWDNADNKDFCSVTLKLRDVSEDPCYNISEDNITWPLDEIALSVQNVNINTISAQFSPENLVAIYGYSEFEVIPTFDTDCPNALVYSYDDVIIPNGGINFKIIRTFTVLDWYSGNTYTYHQIIKNEDGSADICDFLPNTAPVGDCDSGHTLDDDVEWPADIFFADHRITPAELQAFSGIPAKDASPIFYNSNASLYKASYVDLLNSLSTTELVLSREWTVTRSDNPNLSWQYTQLLTIDITIFSNLVTINTLNNRPIPNVQVVNGITTDLNGAAIVTGPEAPDPFLGDDARNGLEVRDLVLVQDHILGQSLLNTLQVQAGNLDEDNVITTNDLSLIMQTMIGINSEFSEQWKFLDYTNNTSLGTTPKGHYIGIKPGDVDDSARFEASNVTLPTTELSLTDKLLNAGESYQVPFTLSETLEAWGVELHFEYDTDVMEIVGVYSDFFNSTMIWNETEPGKISAVAVSETGVAQTIGDSASGDVMVYVEFKALQNDVIGENLRLSDSETSYVLLSDDSMKQFAGTLEGEITVSTLDLENKIYVAIYPNPASEFVNFRFSGPLTNREYRIDLYDLQGQKVISNISTSQMDVSQLTSGTYIYTLLMDDKLISGRINVTK